MARYVPDINTKRWVIIAPQRAKRPEEVNTQTAHPQTVTEKDGYNYHFDCPFCLGNEAETPPEIVHHPKDSEKWNIRVVPNKYPITDIHEVIIHSPDHVKDISEFSHEHVVNLMKVYRDRYNVLGEKGTVLIFNNKGLQSGESLVHPHSQAVVLPKQIALDVLNLEPVSNIVHDNSVFVTFCPDFSQWSYETWIAPKKCCEIGHSEQCKFGDSTDSELEQLARMLQDTLKKLTTKFPKLSYNYYIYPYSCWYMRIIPRLAERAGFELGTGLSVNTVDPITAAEELGKTEA